MQPVKALISKTFFKKQQIFRAENDTFFANELLIDTDNNLTIEEILKKDKYFIRHNRRLLMETGHVIASHRELKNKNVFFNLTPGQISSEDFLEVFDLFSNQISNPEQIYIEVTETNDNHNLDCLAFNLSRIREKGHKIAMDDFGTGVSNFGNVLILKPDLIKLDKSIIQNAVTDIWGRRCFLNIVNFIKNIGCECICEGVELQAHLELVRESGCDYYQGYLADLPKYLSSEVVNV